MPGNDISILNYKGDAGLALGTQGSPTGIVEWGQSNSDGAVQAMKDFASRQQEVNDMNYKQKIADRNKMFDMVANLQLDTDKVLPEARQGLKDKIKAAEDIYLNNPDILNNREAYVKMQKAIRDFNELNAYAKTNYKTVTEDISTASKLEDPDDRKNYLDHVNVQREKLKGNQYDLYTPYPNQLKWSYDTMAPDVKPVEKKVSEDGFNDVIEYHKDPNEMLKNYNWGVVEGNNKKMRNEWTDWKNNYINDDYKAPADRVDEFAVWNDKIEKANKYITDPTKKIKPVQFDDKTGKPQFNSSFTKEDFDRSAYIALRFDEGQKKVYNSDRQKAAEAQAKIDKDKAETKEKLALIPHKIEELKSKAGKNWADAALKRYKITSSKAGDKAKNDSSNVWPHIIKNMKIIELFKPDGTSLGKQPLVNVHDLPKDFVKLVNIAPIKGWKGQEYYNVQESPYFIGPDGTKYTTDELKLKYNESGGDKKWKTYDNYTDYLNKHDVKPELMLRGADGTATSYSTSIEAEKTQGKQGDKKGVHIYNEDNANPNNDTETND